MIDVLVDSTLCLFEGRDCTWHGHCRECLLERVDWAVTDEAEAERSE